MAVLEMTDKINEVMENNQFSIGVFVDLSKACDTLNHNILLNKLYYYGIRGVSYEWFKSYLSNRYQYVHFHRLRGSASTVLTATGQVIGRWRILTPHRIETHEPTATKFRTIDYVRGRTP